MSTLAITGVTGFVGRAVARAAAEAGHRVIGFSRNPARASAVPAVDEGRAFPSSGVPDFSGVDAVIHLAGESIFGLWTPAKRHRIMESRCAGTRAVVQGIASLAHPIPLISASGAGYYGDTGEIPADEDSPIGCDFLAHVCREWEGEARAAEALGSRVVLLRIGIILDDGGGMLATLRPLFRLGLGGRLGSGQQWMSWISLTDVVRLALTCAEDANARGVYNAVSPSPIRNRDLTRAIARRWHRPAPFAVPGFLLRGALGQLGAMILQNQRVLPRRTLSLPFRFTVEDLAELPPGAP